MDLLSEKILNTFPDVSINKELSRDSGLAAYALPDYVADWLVSKYAHGQTLDRNRVGQFVRRYMPDKIQANIIKKELMEGEECKILGSFKVEPDLKRKTYKLEIPSLEIKDALIDLEVLNSNEPLLTGYVWGSGTLAYDPSNRNVVMIDFKPMQTMEVDLDFYIKQRKNYHLVEWQDMIIRTMGYNPMYYSAEARKWLFARLLPFVAANVNLIELAPKNTGKSYLYAKFSKYAWLISGGIVTRAQLFYDMGQHKHGVINHYDIIILDEVQTISFKDPLQVVGALKGYLESGEYRVMSYYGKSEAGFVMIANIEMTAGGTKPVDEFLFDKLPEFMHETALLDRFCGILPGWELPKLESNFLSPGYALRADYLGEVFHSLRKDSRYFAYANERIPHGDQRDRRSIVRVASGYLKLLFPDLESPELTKDNFYNYCVEPAIHMRTMLKKQMALKDREYMPYVKLNPFETC